MAVKTAEVESKKLRKHEKVISQLYKVNTKDCLHVHFYNYLGHKCYLINAGCK
jgi:hypothetical protein